MDILENDSEIHERLGEFLEDRIGPVYARQRLGMEITQAAQALNHSLNFLEVENWHSFRGAILSVLKMAGMYGRGQRNAQNVRIRHNYVHSGHLPKAFDGYTILQISDLHAEISENAMKRVIEMLPTLDYDLCVITGDFRDKTFGSFCQAIESVRRLRAHLRGPVFGVLGNHDTIRMTPDLEAMGIRMLLNECVTIEQGRTRIHLAGVDDANYFQTHNIEKAADRIPEEEFSILLSHSPEIYRQAAHAAFDLMLSGHTHGGQICLPGGIPLTLVSRMPRRFGAGAWSYKKMAGYTSVGVGTSTISVRFNCPPEITLHHLKRA